MSKIHILFDGPPGPEAGRFVEVERDGQSIRFGEMKEREDGYWVLEIPDQDAALAALKEENERLKRELAQIKCNFAPIMYYAKQEREKGEPCSVREEDGCPTEGAVLKREWKRLTADLAAARKENDRQYWMKKAQDAEAALDEARGKVDEAIKWLDKHSPPSDDTCYFGGIRETLKQILKGGGE